MQIHGFQKTTLLDYPEHIAATVFTGGCNFCCPFCHNASLVLHPDKVPTIPEEEVLAYLQKRKGVLQGVCITGGEPTVQKGLEDFMRKIRALGLAVKLDTNGYRPDVLKKVLEEGLADYVAMDIKASLRGYAGAAGRPLLDTEKIKESIGLLKSCRIPYEFRTTVVRGLHTEEEFDEIGRLLAGCRVYYLQSYRESEDVLAPGYGAFSGQELERMAARAKKYIDKVELRGVE